MSDPWRVWIKSLGPPGAALVLGFAIWQLAVAWFQIPQVLLPARHHAPLDGVRIVPYTGSVAKFLVDQDYAQQGYVFSEPLVARRQGADPHCLMVSDLGFDPYTSVVAVRLKWLEEHPELARRFVAASRRGWLRYLQAPDQVNQIIHEVNPDMDLASLNEAAEAIRPLCLPAGMDESLLGRMTAERWARLASQMRNIDAISDKTAADVDQAWRNVDVIGGRGTEEQIHPP